MSQQRECLIIEVQPSAWYYVLESPSAPKNAWDWMEYATAYGPFATQEAADKNLSDNHSNPGGYSVQEFNPEWEIEEAVTELIKTARVPSRYSSSRY